MKTSLRLISLGLALLAFPAHAAYQRNPLEQELADWAKARQTISRSPGTLLWSLMSKKDHWKQIKTPYGAIHQHTALNGLITVTSAVDYYLKQGDLEMARAVVHAANEQRLSWLGTDFANTYPGGKYQLVRQRIKDYQPYLDPLKLRSPELLLDASMQFKGYAIDAHLAWHAKRNKLSPEERKTADQINALQKTATLNHKTLQLKPLKGQEASLRKSQAAARIRYDQAVKDLIKFTPEQIAMSNTWVNAGVVPSLAEMRSLIDDKTLVIDLVQARALTDKPYSINAWDRKIYAGAAFDQKGAYGPVVIGDTKPIDALVKAITTGMRSSDPTGNAALVANATRLRQLILDPFLQQVTGKTKLLISLDGELLFAPVPMLPDTQGRFLTEQYEVSFFDSYRQLANLSSHRSPVKPTSSLLAGDPVYLSETMKKQLGEKAERRVLSPLPGTRKEVNLVATLLQNQQKKPVTLLGAMATEAELRKHLTSPQEFIHIATHGGYTKLEGDLDPSERASLNFTNAEDTLRNLRGVIANSSANDGIFQAKDVMSYDLSGTRLVMLSACDTGLGESVQGDIVQGFRGAFFMSGTPQVVITMSPVSDGLAPVLMDLFYRNTAIFSSDVSAWTAAMRSLLKNELFKDKAMAIKLLGPFYFVTHRPAHAQYWPVAPVRGFINWRRPWSTPAAYVAALHDAPEVPLYLTPRFHERLKMIDSSQFGLIPGSAVVSKVVTEGDLAFVKITTEYKWFIFSLIRGKDGRWLIDDLFEGA